MAEVKAELLEAVKERRVDCLLLVDLLLVHNHDSLEGRVDDSFVALILHSDGAVGATSDMEVVLIEEVVERLVDGFEAMESASVAFLHSEDDLVEDLEALLLPLLVFKVTTSEDRHRAFVLL